MKYEVDIPADVEQQLSERATELGHDVVHLIRVAVVDFLSRSQPGQHAPLGLRPDLPADSSEISAPVDLPLAGNRRAIDITVEPRSNLRPDPVSPAE